MDEQVVLLLVFLLLTIAFLHLGDSVLSVIKYMYKEHKESNAPPPGGIHYPLCFYYPYNVYDDYHKELFRSLSQHTYVYVSTDLQDVLEHSKKCYVIFFDALPVNLDNSTVEKIYNLSAVHQKIVIVSGLFKPDGTYHKYFFENLTGLGISVLSTNTELKTLYVGTPLNVPDYGSTSVNVFGTTLYVKYLPKDLDCSRSISSTEAIGYCISTGAKYEPYPYNSRYNLKLTGIGTLPLVVGHGYLILEGTYLTMFRDYRTSVGIPAGWWIFIKDDQGNNVLVGRKYGLGWLLYFGGMDYAGIEHVLLKVLEVLW